MYSQVHMITKYWHVIVILAVTHCTINEQPNVREGHFTLVTSGYHELVDNIEEDTVNIADKCHCEPTFANYTVLWFPSGVPALHWHTLLHQTCWRKLFMTIDKPITVISLPNTPPPNSQRSLCCHQCLYIATSNTPQTPQRGSAFYLALQRMTHSTCCPHTQQIDLQIRDDQEQLAIFLYTKTQGLLD